MPPLVVMPEWQDAGVGMRFLNAVCERWRRGQNRYGKPMPTLFHTSHLGLAAALRRDPAWAQVSATLCGDNKAACRRSPQALVGLARKPPAVDLAATSVPSRVSVIWV